jgi:hypothetical protein
MLAIDLVPAKLSAVTVSATSSWITLKFMSRLTAMNYGHQKISVIFESMGLYKLLYRVIYPSPLTSAQELITFQLDTATRTPGNYPGCV